MDGKAEREGQGGISQLLTWAGPRTVVVPRSPQGFGFTLRHFVVYPPQSAARSPLCEDGDGALWQGSEGQGPEPLDTIFVKTVREGSTAHLAGLTAGDRIVAVNSEPVSGKSYAEVIALIHASSRSLKLLVVPKDEDILQMAYQSQSTDSLSGSTTSLSEPSVTDMQDSNPSPLHKTALQLAMSGSGSQRAGGQQRYGAHGPHHTYTFGMAGRPEDARGRREEFGRARSTQAREDPVPRRTSREGPGRPVSQDSGMRLAGGVPSKAKYSFGLYFPPRHTPSPQSRATSADNLTHSVPVVAERRFRVDSDTSSSTSGSVQDSGSVGSGRDAESLGRTGASTPSPRQSYAQDGSSGVGDYKRDGRYYVPVLNQSSRPSESSAYSNEFRTRSSSDRPQRASVGSSVTVTTQPAAPDRSHRSSLGSSIGRTREYGEGGGGTTFVVRIPVSGTSTSTPQNSFGSSFALTRSPRHTTIDVQRQPPPSQPTHIEVQATPSSKSTHIVEVQRGSPGPLEGGMASNANGNARSVWQRKVLFENGQNENNLPPNTKTPSRLRTELEKLTSQRKFTSVAHRMASFEKSSDEDGERTPGRENTPPTQPQPAVKVRRVSIEQISEQDTVFPEPSASDVYTSVTTSDSFVKVDHRGGEVGSQDEPVSTSTPVRIFVSPSNRSVPVSSPPVVEIVPVCTESKERHPPMSLLPSQPPVQPVQVVQPILRESKSLPPEPTLHHGREPYPMSPESSVHPAVSTQRPLSVHEWPRAADVDWQQQELDYQPGLLGPGEGGLGSRPQRKSSYLSAVNAPTVRYAQTPSPELDERDMPGQHESSPSMFYLPHNNTPSSVMSSSDSAVNFSQRPTPPVSSVLSTSTVEPLPSVVLRKKSADTVEDSMAKLHRRTSYLMATARDRSNNPGLEPAFSPFSVSIPEEPASTPVRQFSLNKLKNFFGEQTPSIVEATERCRVVEPAQPESPLPDITREGPLWCKTAVSDGKKCSDRSWKQVWAVLRGHALFLIKDRRDGNAAPTFSFEEPPISIKSCLVDIAHDYSRKRKHVFRLTTYSESVYLLQAEDKGTMMYWIQAIKTNNNPDHDDEGIGSAELIRRKASTQSDSGLLQTSPQTGHREKDKEKEKDKARKQVSIPFKAKLPHSPSVRRKKPEESSSKKGGWKGRIMPRSFKKQTTEDSALLEEAEDISKCTFGIPLKDCIPSPNNEFVPLIVELCTRIVEVRGLEIVGVYRVPGNSVAVSHIQEELNRGIENMNMDNDKWLDVNVVSSLLKAFFRKLPQPLVTAELYDGFIEANRNSDPEKRMLKLKRLLQMLPEHHYETFKHLAEHLSVVASHGHINKMDAKNLAIMFGPTLIRKVDDDTVSLVTDMSDQCRIVESIILHNEWFFSTWAQDHFVPVDSGEHTHPSATDTRVARDDDEDADSAINTKEIISSIVNAANKKLKLRQQNKSTDSLDFDTTLSQNSSDTVTTATTITSTHSQRPAGGEERGGGGGDAGGEGGVGYQERSVDAAMARAAIIAKSQSSLAKSQSSLASSRSASEDCLDRHTTAPLATSEPDFLDWDERHYYVGRGRHLSDDTLLERSDEVVGGSVGWKTLDWLKRLEQEARTIRQLEEQRQRDMERRRRQQQKIERELQRSQRDLEMEDAQSVEDLLAWSSAATTSTPAPPPSSRSGYPSRPQPLTSSDVATFSREQAERQKLAAVAPRSAAKRFPETVSGGKYFVSVANSRDSFLRPASLENLVEGHAPQFPHTGSLENMVEGSPRDVQHFGPNPGIGQGGGGLRHGSLDSLLDMMSYDQQGGGGSTDSEDGSDLLTSLTTTFDQKLQILLNPKYRLSSRHGRQSHSAARQSGLFGIAESGHHGVDGMGGITQGRGREAGFRDPSLHRASKSDTKVGIASRFQRGGSGVAAATSVPASTATASTVGRYRPLPDFRSFLSRNPRPDGGTGNVVLTQPRKLTSTQTEGVSSTSPSRGTPTRLSDVLQQSRSQARPSFRPFSKSEKMEVNTALARLAQREGGGVKDSSGQPSPAAPQVLEAAVAPEGGRSRSGTDQSASSSGSKGTEGMESSHPKSDSGSVAQVPSAFPQTSSSQQTSEREGGRRGKGGGKRRHTVGGVGDLEHFKALLAVSGPASEPRPSAWEQLCPSSHSHAVSLPPEGRSLQAWMQKERLRGSTPNLLTCDFPSSPSSSSSS
ncbi:rho GTPase-activating protein 21-A-like [Babylonia areolata]|uniref:rho GTPase-activating protein 21-A-like n=1 Tax=Babylonia areolata TaxID=304850 RepID=UPI003FD48744